jgi:hypothetical protein
VQVPSLNSTGTTPPVSVRAYIASPVGADAQNKPTQFAAPDIDSPQVQLNADRDQPCDTLPAYLRARYDLGPVLGKGNYAFVREGIDKATNLKIAMKIVDRTQVKPSAELSIKREVHILGMLTHPNIVRTYAFYEEPNCFYTVLECINGGALFDRLKLRTVFTELQVRELAHVLLSAIQHCHERNVVHRYVLLKIPGLQDNVVPHTGTVLTVSLRIVSHCMGGESHLRCAVARHSRASSHLLVFCTNAGI